MIIMGIDYGDARTGISVCDKFQTLATPVCVVSQWNQDKLIEQIKQKATEYKAELLVVGLPKNMDSSLGERAEKCKEFAQKLSEACNLPYKMIDERLTTVSAHKVLNVTDTRGKKRKDVVDAVAAVMILQDYIDAEKLKNK